MLCYWKDIAIRVPHLIVHGIDRALAIVAMLAFAVGLFAQNYGVNMEDWFRLHQIVPLCIAIFVVLHGIAKAIYEKHRELEEKCNALADEAHPYADETLAFALKHWRERSPQEIDALRRLLVEKRVAAGQTTNLEGCQFVHRDFQGYYTIIPEYVQLVARISQESSG